MISLSRTLLRIASLAVLLFIQPSSAQDDFVAKTVDMKTTKLDAEDSRALETCYKIAKPSESISCVKKLQAGFVDKRDVSWKRFVREIHGFYRMHIQGEPVTLFSGSKKNRIPGYRENGKRCSQMRTTYEGLQCLGRAFEHAYDDEKAAIPDSFGDEQREYDKKRMKGMWRVTNISVATASIETAIYYEGAWGIAGKRCRLLNGENCTLTRKLPAMASIEWNPVGMTAYVDAGRPPTPEASQTPGCPANACAAGTGRGAIDAVATGDAGAIEYDSAKDAIKDTLGQNGNDENGNAAEDDFYRNFFRRQKYPDDLIPRGDGRGDGWKETCPAFVRGRNYIPRSGKYALEEDDSTSGIFKHLGYANSTNNFYIETVRRFARQTAETMARNYAVLPGKSAGIAAARLKTAAMSCGISPEIDKILSNTKATKEKSGQPSLRELFAFESIKDLQRIESLKKELDAMKEKHGEKPKCFDRMDFRCADMRDLQGEIDAIYTARPHLKILWKGSRHYLRARLGDMTFEDYAMSLSARRHSEVKAVLLDMLMDFRSALDGDLDDKRVRQSSKSISRIQIEFVSEACGSPETFVKKHLLFNDSFMRSFIDDNPDGGWVFCREFAKTAVDNKIKKSAAELRMIGIALVAMVPGAGTTVFLYDQHKQRQKREAELEGVTTRCFAGIGSCGAMDDAFAELQKMGRLNGWDIALKLLDGAGLILDFHWLSGMIKTMSQASRLARMAKLLNSTNDTAFLSRVGRRFGIGDDLAKARGKPGEVLELLARVDAKSLKSAFDEFGFASKTKGMKISWKEFGDARALATAKFLKGRMETAPDEVDRIARRINEHLPPENRIKLEDKSRLVEEIMRRVRDNPRLMPLVYRERLTGREVALLGKVLGSRDLRATMRGLRTQTRKGAIKSGEAMTTNEKLDLTGFYRQMRERSRGADEAATYGEIIKMMKSGKMSADGWETLRIIRNTYENAKRLGILDKQGRVGGGVIELFLSAWRKRARIIKDCWLKSGRYK